MTIVLVMILFLVLKRKNYRFTYRRIALLFIGVIVFFYTLMFIRFENIFMSFPSVETVWRYENVGDLKRVIEGSDSSLVIYTRDEGYSFSVYPKSKGGWKLNSAFFEKTQFVSIGNPLKCDVTLCKTKISRECFILIDEFAPYEISDNLMTNFKQIEMFPRGPYVAYYYAIVPVTEEPYKLSVGDETTVLDLK